MQESPATTTSWSMPSETPGMQSFRIHTPRGGARRPDPHAGDVGEADPGRDQFEIVDDVEEVDAWEANAQRQWSPQQRSDRHDWEAEPTVSSQEQQWPTPEPDREGELWDEWARWKACCTCKRPTKRRCGCGHAVCSGCCLRFDVVPENIYCVHCYDLKVEKNVAMRQQYEDRWWHSKWSSSDGSNWVDTGWKASVDNDSNSNWYNDSIMYGKEWNSDIGKEQNDNYGQARKAMKYNWATQGWSPGCKEGCCEARSDTSSDGP